jgi:hypothetical protein
MCQTVPLHTKMLNTCVPADCMLNALELCRSQERLTERVEAALAAVDAQPLTTEHRHALLAFQQKVQLLEKQRVLRATLEAMQEKICNLAERDYRRFQTTVKRYLLSQDKKAQDAHVKCWTERIVAIKEARSALSVKVPPSLVAATLAGLLRNATLLSLNRHMPGFF